ncbi:pectinesterase inhibitor-like [Cucurbita moschata]|uniref:Pectinesterase inhibitor-like n=1 Tax=Cucurbita moschata TaxID=3662 RepID=A0A6J1EWG6_CUCMO|nr:pectinesterase inhibitor-like [Cucurbita moschata]
MRLEKGALPRGLGSGRKDEQERMSRRVTMITSHLENSHDHDPYAHDLKGLATFTLNLAHDKASQSRVLAQSLASKATDPKLKERYATCAEHYDDAVDDIEDGKNYLGKGDYNSVNTMASAAMTEAGDCLDSFMQPPKDPSALSDNGKAVEDICSIILVIGNLLLGRA